MLVRSVVPTIESQCLPEAKGRGRCVLASLVALDVLRALGYREAAVVPCWVTVANAGAIEYERLSQGRNLADQQHLADRLRTERNAHAVIIGAPDDPDRDGGWSGHLVVVVRDFLLDLTLDQASRPDKNIILEPMIVPLAMSSLTLVEDGRMLAGAEHIDTQTVVRWYAAPSNQRYLGAPDANPAKRALFARPLIEAIQRLLVACHHGRS